MQTWLLKIGVYFFRKPRFRLWSLLEDKKYSAIKAVEQNSPDFPLLLWEYISTALVTSPKQDKVFWKDAVYAFLKIHSVTVPDTNLPLVTKHNLQKERKDPWDYSGRLFYFYSNLIASAYGWTVKTISYLPVEAALAYIQEIMTEKQLEEEFVHQHSQTSYTYDKMSKKSKLVSLPRPYWMLPDDKPKKKAPAIPKSLLPVGMVIDLQNETKKAEPE